jgi:hypothetical protein
MIDVIKIVGIILSIPLFLFIIFGIVINWWIEGLVIESILEAFQVNPFIIILISVVGVIILIFTIISVGKSIF